MQTTKIKKKNRSPFPLGRAGDGLLVFAYITCKNLSEAEKIGTTLVKEKLCACVNVFPKIYSVYLWKGKVEKANETVLIAKTTKKLFPELSEKVKSMHSYSCPCILQIPITDGNKEYVEWLMKTCIPILNEPALRRPGFAKK